MITGTTRLGGLLGSPVAHSLSPAIHNESFRELGLDFVYLCFDVGKEALPCVVAALREMNVYGFNITMPDKEAVVPLLDGLTEAAGLIRAVNTVCNENGKLIGHNTDGVGFMRSVREIGADPAGKEMTLMGCGGAAQAIAFQAALDGTRVLHLACRHSSSWKKAEDIVDRINKNTPCRADLTDLQDEAEMRRILDCSMLLANATSVGMGDHADRMPLAFPRLLREDLVVVDAIYNPRTTRLLREADAAGCRTANGLGMFLYQAEAAFRIWTGKEMPVDHIRSMFFI